MEVDIVEFLATSQLEHLREIFEKEKVAYPKFEQFKINNKSSLRHIFVLCMS